MNRPMIFGKKGFSLTEVLIGLVFLAIGLLAIASLQVTSVRGNFFSNNLMQATYAAQDGLESLKNLRMDDPSLGIGSHNDVPVIISDLTFNRSYSVVSIPDPNGNYLEIDYLVRWNDGTNHKISFSTIRSQ
jgi:prepilin-type N-terminal cleavage/methylation domain-containing protein